MKFKKYDVYCPACGHLNKNLYLEETHGWMECENCLAVKRIRVELKNTLHKLRKPSAPYAEAV